MTEMLVRGIPSLAAICTSSTISFSKVIYNSSASFKKFIMFLSKFPENIDNEFKITLLSLLINFKYNNASTKAPPSFTANLSERYDCLYDYFLDHEDIISQYSTFDFSNERCFDKSNLDCVAKRLLPKDCHALFPVFTKGDGNCLYGSISLLLTGEQSQL